MLMACSDSDPGQVRNGGSGEVDGGVGAAQARSCGSGLVARSGRRIDLERGCLAEAAEVGCAKVSDGCDDALGYVRDAQGRIWQFGDLCLPIGLERLSETQENHWGSLGLCDPVPREVFKGCSQLSTSGCASEPDCREITGTQYDDTRHCRWQMPAVVGCMQADDSCPPDIVYARYPGMDEVAFEIASGCIPAKFIRLDPPSNGISSWPLCTALGSASDAACSIDEQVTRRAIGEKVVDCGNLPRLADSTARAAADRCVLDAQSTQRPFKLIVWMQGIDSYIAYAYISPGAGGRVSILDYDSFSSPSGGSIGMQTCFSLRAVVSCQASASTLCLECVDKSEISNVCQGPAR
jgi:hypothetical protein